MYSVWWTKLCAEVLFITVHLIWPWWYLLDWKKNCNGLLSSRPLPSRILSFTCYTIGIYPMGLYQLDIYYFGLLPSGLLLIIDLPIAVLLWRLLPDLDCYLNKVQKNHFLCSSVLFCYVLLDLLNIFTCYWKINPLFFDINCYDKTIWKEIGHLDLCMISPHFSIIREGTQSSSFLLKKLIWIVSLGKLLVYQSFVKYLYYIIKID